MHQGNQAAVPRLRWGIGALLGMGVLINYLDRISVSVAGPQLQSAFGLSNQELGLLFSAFFWTYAMLQIPVGMVLDKFGVTRIGRWGAFLWVVASSITALAGGFGGLFAARALLGIAEAPGFPASAKATGYWFPRRERAMATALFDAAAKFSSVIGVPLVAYAVVTLGWRWGFGVTALLSLAYFLAFWAFYRDPSHHPRLSAAEADYIRQGGATAEGESQTGSLATLGYLLRQRKMWGLTIGFAAYGYSFYLFLTWLPGFLVQSMHMSILKSASFAAVPWMCATVSDLLVGGWLIDHLVQRGLDETRVRKGVLVTGMLFGLSVFGAVWTHDPYWAIAWISLALSGLAAAAPVSWSLPSLIAPKGATGTVGGIMNFANNMMGVVAPIVTGFLVGASHSFTNAFLVAGLVLLVGIFAFIVLLGRIEPIAEP
ncbi:MFS transporter [Paludibacterium purpuratum]|uniref:Sugar phosphate permease n=1 Tax=Paludibacterium purpuratum TaxID=1144873 RepID=A0A4R7B5H9_9NEIS|nr:MFS transporter [Paludibacterium purpuratum]TDR79930.1 sugar phosphate permease [Paludibacterium purpuratum]